MRPTPSLVAVSAVGLVLAGCNSGSDTAADDTAVVATTTMLGSVVGDIVACAGGTVETLMPVGADPHDFSASSAQVASVVNADLVVANGFGLEEGLTDALESAEADGTTVLEVAPQVDPIEFGGGDHDHDHDEEAHDEEAHDEEAHDEDGHDHDEEAHDEDGHDHDEEAHDEDEHEPSTSPTTTTARWTRTSGTTRLAWPREPS